MWKWIAITSLFALALQAGWPARQTVIAKDQFPDASVPQRIADAAIQRIKEKDLHGALAIVSETETKKLSAEASAAIIDNGVRQLTKQLLVMDGLGQPLGEIEFLGREVIGKSYVVFNYLERFERRALVWRITFYRSRDEWVLANFEWNQDLRPLFRADSAESDEPR